MARKSNRRAEPAQAAEVETVDKPGMGIDEGIVLFTFILLAIAVTCVVMANQIYTS